MIHQRIIRGELAYIHDAEGPVGHEWFTVSVDAAGGRVVRTRCEMWRDEVLRDVVWSMDERWRPLEGYVRLTLGGSYSGSLWCLFDDNVVVAEGDSVAGGRIRQRLELGEPIAIFGAHPVSGDAMKPAVFDRRRPERRQSFASVSTSPLPNGASGPILTARRNTFEWIGDETITVKAGRFACSRFRWHFTEFPPIEIWSSGPDFLPVRVRWDLLKSNYDLVALAID